MPPDSTKNLNAKLSPREEERTESEGSIHWQVSPIQGSAPPVRIVGGATPYHGGYHVDC